MSSLKELNGPLGSEFHSFFKIGGDSDTHPCSSADLSPDSNDLTHHSQGELFIPFDQSGHRKQLPETCGETGQTRSSTVQHLRATMPDQTRCIFNAVVSTLSDPITIDKSTVVKQKQSKPLYIPITEAVVKHKVSAQPHISPKLSRRYSKPQGESCDSDSENQQESSVDGPHQDDIVLLKKFQNSVKDSRYARRRSSPDLLANLSPKRNVVGFSIPTNNDKEVASDISSSSNASTAIAPAGTVKARIDFPKQKPSFPVQRSILSKMVGSRGGNPQQVDNGVTQNSPPTLTPSKSCPKFQKLQDNSQYIDVYSVQNDSEQSSAMLPSQPKSAILNSDSSKCDSVDSSSSNSSFSSSGFGFLSRTRQFGTWLGITSDSAEKVEISKKDLNVFAPTTF